MSLRLPSLPAALVGLVAVAVVVPLALRHADPRETAAHLVPGAGQPPATSTARPAPADPACAGPAPDAERADFEERTVFLVNEERRAAGLPPLKRVEPLTLSARFFASLMATTTSSPMTTTRTGVAPAGSCASATGPIASRPSTRGGTRSARTSPSVTRARRRSWPPGWTRPCTARRSSAAVTGRRVPATRPPGPRAATGCRTSAVAAEPSRSSSTARLRARARGRCGCSSTATGARCACATTTRRSRRGARSRGSSSGRCAAAPGFRTVTVEVRGEERQGASASDSIRLEAQPM